jgi:hypothetical protein
MTTLFNLPENILTEIYEMDSTYRDKFKNEINKEIYTSSFDRFRTKYTENLMNQHVNIIDKFDVLLKFIFDKYISEYEKDLYCNHLFTDQINIYSNYGEQDELQSKIYVRIDDYSDDPEIDDDSEIFEGWIYTIEQYNEMLDELSGNKKYTDRLKNYIAFQNNKYVIAYVDYDYETEYEEEEQYEDDFEFRYGNDEI